MFENVRDDFITHGRSLRSGAFWTMAVYRFGRWSMAQNSPVAHSATSRIYAVLRAVTHFATGVLLERETEVGKGFHIIHTGAIAIHPDAVIGQRVGIMHGVTLGTNMGESAPVIGDDVFIGCNASILGGVTIGDGARISANSLVISDVPAGAVAIGVPAKTATFGVPAKPASATLGVPARTVSVGLGNGRPREQKARNGGSS